MPEGTETNTPAPAVNEANQNPTPAPAVNEANTQAPAVNESESLTFTTEQLNKRLEREREKAKKDFETSQAEAKRQAELSAEEKARELEAKLTKQQEEFAAKEVRLERKSKLLEKVSNADRVLALIELEGKSDEFFDGNIPNIEAILKAYQEYAPAQSGAAPTGGAGGRVPGTNKEGQIAAALARGDMTTYIALTNS